MGKSVIKLEKDYVIVERGGESLQNGDLYFPGEMLKVIQVMLKW
jgi:hypothetical protein